MEVNDSKTHNILGLNERNLRYIRKYNPSSAKKYADDKLLTKKLLAKYGITTPRLVAKISNFKQLERFNFNKLPGSIVLKPKMGFGGEGIVVFFSRDKNGNWVKADKTRYSIEDLKVHIAGILEGNYSLKNRPDVAFFEERVIMHPDFKKFSYKGMPDIRVVVFNHVPIMAELRLATKESDGKANLHSGGIGVGIDIASGITTMAVRYDKPIETHPDFGVGLRGIRIPYWTRILELAVKAQIYSGLKFLAADLVIDRVHGPMILELNARPGLAIQIANQDGLKGRLNRVEGLKITNSGRGVQVGKNLFGGEVEEEIEEVSGKQLVGRVEYATFYGYSEIHKKIKIKNDTGALWSSISEKLATELGFGDVIKEFDKFETGHSFKTLKEGVKLKLLAQRAFEDHSEIVNIALIKQSTGLDLRPVIMLEFEMSGVRVKSKFTITHRRDLVYEAIIGRKALKKFLIDPAKKFLG